MLARTLAYNRKALGSIKPLIHLPKLLSTHITAECGSSHWPAITGGMQQIQGRSMLYREFKNHLENSETLIQPKKGEKKWKLGRNVVQL